MTAEQLAEAMRILEEAAALDIVYTKIPMPQRDEKDDGFAYSYMSGTWNILVARVGARYDGAVRKDNVLVHMTPEIAERIFKKAETPTP